MRKPLLIVGAIILLVCTMFLMGGIYEEYFSIPLTIKYEGQVIHKEKCSISVWRLGMKERSGSYEKLFVKTVSEGHSPVEALNFLSNGLGNRMERLAKDYEKPPVDATFSVNQSVPFFTYTPDVDGKTVDMYVFAKKVARALDNGHADLVLIRKKANITEDMLKAKTQLRGAFTTNFRTSTAERKSNIKLALSSINGTTIMPEEEFSFNKVVGPRKAERGYKSAKIISQGKFIEGIGGGVCQVSTTLYNTVLLSDLQVSYATRHSLPVSYVLPSRDAMVSSTNDFKFINSTDNPIYIFTKSENDIAEIYIYGQKKDCIIELQSEVIKRIPYNNYTASGQLLNNPDGYRRLCAGKAGLVSELYLVRDGIRERIRHDIYSPQHSLWIQIESDAVNPTELTEPYNAYYDIIDFENVGIDF